MKPATSLIYLLTLVWLCLPASLSGQPFRFDLQQYDRAGGIIKLGWESSSNAVYSLESSTNLIGWQELKSHPLTLLRFTGAPGNRTEIEISAPAARAGFYRVRKLRVLDIAGGRFGETLALKDVNDAGRVVGFFYTGANTRGFTWAPGEEFVSFGDGTRATAVNQQGTVVGSTNIWVPELGMLVTHFFTWNSGGGMVVHGQGLPVDVNTNGHLVGYEVDLNRQWTRSFLWKPATGKVYLPHLDPATETTVPSALSDAGHIVGDSLINESYYRAFYWTESGGIVDIANGQSNALDVNSSGQVIGQRTLSDGTSRAYLWSAAGGIVNLPPNCSPKDINNKGQVVGTGDKGEAFLWTSAGGIVSLGVLSPNSYSASNALSVNENGQVAGDSLGLIQGVGGLHQSFFWSLGTGMVQLDSLSYPQAAASLISNSGLVFGYGFADSSRTPHLLMWDMINPQ